MRTNIEDALIEIIRKVVIEKSEVSLSVSTEEEKAEMREKEEYILSKLGITRE